MKKVILLHKKEGETPLEALENFRTKHKAYKNVPMTYAGRLDPLVSGLLLILAGEARLEKEKYSGLSKEYEFDVLFGFATDTFDILGKVTKVVRQNFVIKDLEKKIKENLKFFTGKFFQKYPLYSSKTIKKARRGESVEREERVVSVKDLKFIKLRKISAKIFLKNTERRIKKVKGDFRQKEILKIWRKELTNKKSNFSVALFYVKCGPGMYVRALANDLGEKLKIPSLALTIKRTKIGKWSKMSK